MNKSLINSILHWPKAWKYLKWLLTSCVKWRNHGVKWRDLGVKSWWASLQWVSSEMVVVWLCCHWEHSFFWNGSLRDCVWEQLSKYVKQESTHKENMTRTLLQYVWHVDYLKACLLEKHAHHVEREDLNLWFLMVKANKNGIQLFIQLNTSY